MMADAPWYSLLPTAPTTQGAFNGADLAQQGQRQAIANQQAATEAQRAQYNFGLQKATEGIMAAAMGPNGVDQNKFYALASQTPYGISAVKAYADVAFPQMQKQAVERGGSVQNGAQADQMIAANPNMGASIRSGAQAALTGPTSPLATTLGELRLKAPIAAYNPTSSLPTPTHWSQQAPTNQMAPQVQDMPTATPPNIAAASTDTPPAPQWSQESSMSPATPAEVNEPPAPGPYETAMSMDPNIGIQASKPTPVVPFNASKLTSQQKTQLAGALKAASIDPSDLSVGATQKVQSDINAARAVANAPVYDKEGNIDPLAMAKNRQIFEASVPSLIQSGYAGLLKSGQEQTGANLGQSAASNSLKATATAEANRQKYAATLGADPDALGLYGSPDAGKSGKAMDQRGGAYIALRQQTQELAQKLPSLLLPQNAIALGQEEGSLTRLVNNVAGASGTEGAMRTSLSEAGVPQTLLDSYSPMDAFRTFIKQADPTIAQNAIRKLPDILYRNVLVPDMHTLRMDPDAWKAKLDKQAHWSNQTPDGGSRQSNGGNSPKPGDENSQGLVWTGKRWL